MRIKVVCLIIALIEYSEGISKESGMMDTDLSNEIKYNELDEHALVTDSDLFPFMAAILEKAKFISNGVLIDNSWVLTAADSLFLIRESSRMLRVRLGSINYRKGGIVLPVKYFKIHPNFDDHKPIYDLALIRLPESVSFTPSLKAIKLQESMTDADATHFIVPSWFNPMMSSAESEQLNSMELIKRRRILSVTHLHPTNDEECVEELSATGVNDTDNTMCLDTGVMIDPCMRDIGAPVIVNGLLSGIVSSWRPNDCNTDLAGPTFVTLVSSTNISTWIDATRREHKRKTFKQF